MRPWNPKVDAEGAQSYTRQQAVTAIKNNYKTAAIQSIAQKMIGVPTCFIWGAKYPLPLLSGATLTSSISSNLWRRLLIKIATFKTLNFGVRHLHRAFNFPSQGLSHRLPAG